MTPKEATQNTCLGMYLIDREALRTALYIYKEISCNIHLYVLAFSHGTDYAGKVMNPFPFDRCVSTVEPTYDPYLFVINRKIIA